MASAVHQAGDPSGINTHAGPPPRLALTGAADPGAAQTRRAGLDSQLDQATGSATRDIAEPVGEDSITVTAPATSLKAALVPAKGKAPAGPALKADLNARGEAIGILAEKERGAEIKAAMTQARADMAARRAQHAADEAQQRADARQQTASMKAEAEAEQARARQDARAEVDQARGEWQAELDQKSAEARQRADAELEAGMQKVDAEQQRADAEAAQHIARGESEAEAERQKAESEVASKKQEAEDNKSGGGFFGWVASKARAFFDGIKQAISAVIDVAREAVQLAISAAKKLATAAIEAARRVIVAAIQAVGEALMAIGDALLAAFPEMRARFRARMQSLVDRATHAVNQLASALEDGVQKALDLLGEGLDAALGLLEKGLHAIVDGVAAVVDGALEAAEAVAASLGGFLALVKDVAAAPGQWLSNLGAAIMDGIRNHLWQAFQTAVSEWFKSKVVEVLGIGGMVMQILLQGGLDLTKIGKMAWEALRSAIPAALIAILVEKLVSMIVPAAGAVMAIIEGLQAAWGTIQRIVAAMSAFMAFLEAVKGGNAGPRFAQMLALAAVVVLDFVANWLLKKLRRAAAKVGRKLKALAKKLARRFRRRRGGAGNRQRSSERRKKRDDEDEHEDDRAKKQRRLDKAVAAIRPKAEALVDKGVSRLRLRTMLRYWRVRYRLSSLHLESSGAIEAVVNPKATVIVSHKMTPAEIGRALQPVLEKAEQEFLRKLAQQRSAASRRRMEKAREELTSKPDAELPHLHRHEEVELLRSLGPGSLNPATRGKNNQYSSTKVKGGTIESGSTLLNVDESGGIDLAQAWVSGAGKYDESDPRSITRHVKALEEEYGPQEALRRLSPSRRRLLLSVEPARKPGNFLTSRIGEEMANIGLAKPSEVLTGEMAPMAFSGATSDDEDNLLERQQRIGRLFQRLRDSIERQDIYGKSAGAALRKLALAVERFLGAHLRSTAQGGEVSEATMARLQSQLVATLMNFQGDR